MLTMMGIQMRTSTSTQQLTPQLQTYTQMVRSTRIRLHMAIKGTIVRSVTRLLKLYCDVSVMKGRKC